MANEATSCEDMSLSTHNDDLVSEGDERSTKQFTFEENHDPYETKAYLHRKFPGFEFSKTFFVVLSLVVTIFVIGIVVIAVSFKSSVDPSKASSQQPNLARSLVLSSSADDNLWIFEVDNGKHRVLQKTIDKVVALDTYADKTVFWSETNNVSRIASLADRGFPNVNHSLRWKPQAVALDYVTEKIYLIDRESGTLNVIDATDSERYGVVMSNLVQPVDLALDPAEGLLFVVQRSLSIIRANMDGTSSRPIIESPKISALSIDRKATRLYWANDKVSIESSDYDGRNRQQVSPIPMSVRSLAIFENRLFWTRDNLPDDDFVCPCTNMLWSCTIIRKSCANLTSHRLSFQSPAVVRTGLDQQRRHAQNNPCQGASNGGCQQLCLLTSRGSHDCACRVGWQLEKNGRNCTRVGSLLLYVQGSFVRAKVLGSKVAAPFSDALLPTSYRVDSLEKKPLIHFDYDMATGDFYFSDDHSIFRMNLIKDDQQTKIFSLAGVDNHKIRDLAFDWAQNCIYYVQESQAAAYNHTIGMFSVRKDSSNPRKKIILTTSFKKEHYIDSPFFLQIHPVHEYLFYTEHNGNTDNLERLGTNGRGARLLSVVYDTMFTFLTLDLRRSRIYWSSYVDTSLIRSFDLDGSEERVVQVRDAVKTPSSLAVEGDWMYIGNYTEIWMFSEKTGENATKIVAPRYDEKGNPEYLHGLAVYVDALRRID
ncbi:low-density lipoprotein receptor-related protein 6 [Nasonia vitripennis]|uniref:Uncharacterized protein n=1 Tax=Nasonia vitripennis TaxID=7425 RepID=A0A7M7QPQ1_NASVI|nr:low-density lipoprotein receptor-related protein 6 [Nasonia vitripennis]